MWSAADFQVKIRGYRIELGEIEALLRKQASCGFRGSGGGQVVHEDAHAGDRLVGLRMSLPQSGSESIDVETLKREVLSAEVCPRYMVPAQH